MSVDAMFAGNGTLAIVGASARAAAFSAMRTGRDVIAADLFADVDLARRCQTTRVVSYPDDFEPWLRSTACDGWMYTGALENFPGLIGRLAAIRPLRGNAGETVRRVRDPMILQEVLTRADLRFPQTMTQTMTQTMAITSDAPREATWLAKSYHGSSGSGVRRADRATSGAKYVQRRVDGVSASAVFLGERLLGTTQQLVGELWTGAAEFQYCGTIAPVLLPAAAEMDLRRLGEVLAAEFELVGLYGVDLIIEDGRPWIIEVNPRYTAAVEVVEQAAARETYCGKAILFATTPLTVTAKLSEQLSDQAGDLSWPLLADIPAAGVLISPGQPVLTTFAEAESPDEVAGKLQRQVVELRQRIENQALR